ncbi:MAG: hypothetical protein RIS81_1236, partial [Actinomycetota bacterium]
MVGHLRTSKESWRARTRHCDGSEVARRRDNCFIVVVALFSTGGIGGVHRGAETTGDISSDLGAIAAHNIVTVCAGAKSFLDLPRTLEYLETLSVPVIGLGCDFFPEFTVHHGAIAIPTRVDTVKELADIVRAN